MLNTKKQLEQSEQSEQSEKHVNNVTKKLNMRKI